MLQQTPAKKESSHHEAHPSPITGGHQLAQATPLRQPCDDLSQLSPPARDLTTTAPLKESPTEVASASQPPTRSLSVGTIAKTAATSAAVWSGLGASVVCLDSSVLGVLGHGLSTLWTFRNELREKAGELHDTNTTAKRVGKPGYLGVALDALYSPGFSKVAAGITYLAAGVEAGARGRPLECAVFSGYFVGCMTVVAVLNQSYSGTRTTTTLPERLFKKAWGALPSRYQTLLKDPGVYMTLGNGSLVVGTMNLQNLTSQPIATAVLATGLAISSLGLVPTITSFFRGAESQKGQAGSVYLNAAANGLFGVASLLQGSPVVGAAKMCWAVACGLIARMMASGPKK